MIDKAKYYNLINKTYYKKMGRVSKVIGLTVESIGPDAKLNDVCKILLRDKPGQHINAEVVGFKDNRIVLMPFENVDGIGPVLLKIPTRRLMSMWEKGFLARR